jgi:hypothetical protein
VTADRWQQIALAGLVEPSDHQHEALREPLVEHVGHLPVLASFLYPHIEHARDVDLGRALIMLSIHDIGETVTGEVFAYDKTQVHTADEYHAALSILHEHYHPYLDEYEANESLAAKYAKSIDILAPNIHEVDMPHATLDRFRKLGASIQHVIDKKRPFMEWDPVLLSIFDLLMEQYARVEAGEEPLFPPAPYDRV